MYKLFLDDERFPVDDGWVIARSYEDAVAAVEARGFPVFVSFDNDLGDGCIEGRQFAQWLVDTDIDSGTMPADFGWYAHTQNPVARDAINGLMNSYMAHKGRD